MNKPILSHRRIDQLRAIAFDCGFTSEDAKRFGKLSKTATWEALLETYDIPPQVADIANLTESLDTRVEAKSQKQPIRLVRSRLAAKAARALWRELVAEIVGKTLDDSVDDGDTVDNGLND